DGGDTWIQYPDGNHFLPSQGDDWERIAFDLPEAVYNHENVRIRWTLNSMAGVTGGWCEIQDVVVTGYPAYTLTIACDGEGNTEPEPGAYSFDEGQSVRVEALAEVEGWIFHKWVVDGEEIEEAELTIFMDKDKVATAYFIEWPNPDPTVAIESQPQDGATRVPTDTELGWTYRHNEDYKNPLGYRLIIGKSSTLEDATELYVAGGPGEYLVYPPIDLEQSTEYFWQVVPTTNGGGIIRANILDNDDATRGDAEECPIWSFKTSFEVIDRVTWAEDFTDREFPPEGWGSLQVAGEGLFERSIYGDDPETGPYSSPGMAAFFSHEYAAGTSAALVTPKIDLEEGEYRFSFWMYRDHALHDKADRVVLYKNNQPNLTGATEIQTYHRTTALEPTEEEEGWHYYSRIVQISGTEPEYIIIKAIGEGGNNMYLDYVSLEYAPANPTLDVTPIAHNFGRQKIHTESEPMTFTLKNIGSGVITLDPDKIILEGDDQDSFILTNIEEQIELRAEESTTIQVTFAPESVGEKRVDLIIDDNIQPPSLLINQLRKGNGVDTEQTRSNHIVNISGVGYETILYLPLVESFDASEKPEDWKAVPGGTSNWVISETAEAGGESFELKCEKIGDTGYTRFSTPAIHTDGMTLLLLSFKHKLNVTGDNVEVTIEASHDEEYWQEQLWQLKAEDVSDGAEEVVTYIVHPIFEKTYISWVVQGDDEDFDSWYIDDIKVEMSDLRRISGIVTSPFDRAELQGALVEIIDTDLSALTNMYGIYHIIGTPMGIFDIKASYEGHTTHTYENYELGEDKITNIDFILHEKTSLNITGRVVGSDDPANGLADAQLILALDDYSESIITDETGYFAFEWMPQYNTYELRIIHPKYETIIREIVAEFDDIELGDLYMKELTSPPVNVVAEVQNNDELLLSWEKALTPATGEWLETFAEGVLPQGWGITGVNTDTSGEYPGYWTIIQDASIDENYGAIIFWSLEHQDEWLITNEFICPTGDLSYWTFGYQGSQKGDNYYVKVST
ncbi:MAG: hypothetical protein WCX83_06200, partial [Candidatus Cloacimonas sp.]|nr:hypothetical protein [Candidatus Cloacimonadota bacterium]